MTEAEFGTAGEYHWTQEGGESLTDREGSYSTDNIRVVETPFGRHEYGTINLNYRQKEFYNPLGWQDPTDQKSTAKYLFSGDILILYNDKEILEIFSDLPGTNSPLYSESYEVTASSELTEQLSSGPITYSASNITPDVSLSDFWAEGETGKGEGSTLSIRPSYEWDFLVKRVIIFNGVYRRADLFEKNARPEEIELSSPGQESLVFTLPDEREPVILPVGPWDWNRGIEISVKSVYPGTSWEDMCLSSLLVLWEEE
ncbi:MAG: hypothetical protein PQJ59_03950 [Spirochaetales bacterium]|nr:hypothetical protein [Spirochaetales bacterium]